jgi:hypothetical protein
MKAHASDGAWLDGGEVKSPVLKRKGKYDMIQKEWCTTSRAH